MQVKVDKKINTNPRIAVLRKKEIEDCTCDSENYCFPCKHILYQKLINGNSESAIICENGIPNIYF